MLPLLALATAALAGPGSRAVAGFAIATALVLLILGVFAWALHRGQFDDEPRAATGPLALGPCAATHRLRERPYDGQSDPGPAGCARSSRPAARWRSAWPTRC